jgi:hypothetical protein
LPAGMLESVRDAEKNRLGGNGADELQAHG